MSLNRMPGRKSVSLACVALSSLLLVGAGPAERDWKATLRTDAQALHDDIAANHPGPVNPEDPDFARRNQDQLRLALQRAEAARTFPDYFHALRGYVAAFDDGHLSFGVRGATPATRWPLFLTGYEPDGTQRVVARADNAPVPLGARLLGCDGRTADRLAEENIGRFFGRWSLLSQRRFFGRFLFADEGNPYVRRPERCTFEVAGRREEMTLQWEPIDNGEMRRILSPQPEQRVPIETRTFASGTRWISLPTFRSEGPAGQALTSLIGSLRTERAALAAAPAIVLDLRGNDGGSSDWSRQIAEIVWGRAALHRLPPNNFHVDWRASQANLDSLRQQRERTIAAGALSPEMGRWFDVVTRGLEGALARGEVLWRERWDDGGDGREAGREAREEGGQPPPEGAVYFITDAGCSSACLDAVDLWRALGAVHVGQTTSADTLYMDVRHRWLPSELGGIGVPRKVYRGRPRGNNEPVVPAHQFTGAIADTAALERWIRGLPQRRAVGRRHLPSRSR